MFVFDVTIRLAVLSVSALELTTPQSCRGVAQPGSAPALGAGGPEFKSRRPDHLLLCFQCTVPDTAASEAELGSNLGPSTSLSTLSTARRCSSGIACK